MAEPTIEEQLAIVTNSRNALLLSTDQLYQQNQKALADHTKALADQATEHQEAITKLEDDKTKLTTDLATATTQLEATTQAKTTLEAEKAELRELYDDLRQTLTEEEQLTATLQAKIADLEQYRPFNPRWLDGRSFYKRISQQDMETLLASDNPQLVIVGKTILAYRDNHVQWPVILDSTDFTNLVGYVLQSGVFDAAEVTEIMRDATREEAYRVPE
jgi:predicted nuclease with TOPRIM domain